MKLDIAFLAKEGEGLTLEFKEKYSSKIAQDICAFANSTGGQILLGISDNGTILGEKLTGAMKAEIFSLGRNCDPPIEVKVEQVEQVVVVSVSAGDEKSHACGGAYYKRFDAVTQKLTRGEVRGLFEKSVAVHFDEKIHPRATIDDLSLDKIRAFIYETGKRYSVTKATLPQLLNSLRLVDRGHLTNACLMMFAKDPGKFMLHCQTHLAAFKGTERVNIYDKKYVRDDLLTQFNEAVAFCEKHLNERAEIRGVNRFDIYEIPMEAIREAIVNAIVHRDYSMGGTNIMVEVHADRVEISNPGGLPAGFSTAMLGKRSFRRNELIADLFHRMDKSERMGSGIERMRRTLKFAGVKLPRFKSDLFFTIIFERPEEYRTVKENLKGSVTTPKLPQKTTPKITDQLIGETAAKLLNLLETDPTLTRSEMALSLRVTLDGVKYHLKNLQKMQLIKRVGGRKQGRWERIK